MPRVLAALLLFTTACATAPPPPLHDYRIIAYVRGRADIPRIGAEKLTHINYAFGYVSREGEAYIRDDAPAHLAQLNALKSKNPALKILLSIGGWGADHFSDAALTAESREKFARSVTALVERHALDGADIDWEYPGQPGPGIGHRPEDRRNFTLMLAALRQHLGDRLLTIASSGGESYFANTEMETLHRYLNFINVMTYDFAGSWSELTGHHTPLYRSAFSPDRPAAADFIDRHLRAGIPREKIVLGVAFYGRSWKGVEAWTQPLNRPYDAYDVDLPYVRITTEHLTSGEFVRMWDESARAPYLWDQTSRRVVSYDDPQSLREKAAYVKKLGLGGVMYWEHSHDPEERLLDVLDQELKP
ncbi:MAG TPA: glycoside hydrolase family 18 protein [Thermoanaerobaculia bacterium]|nr:glycoside hydrolase family 18 protein [Thermoanaerobaculia bacterium]